MGSSDGPAGRSARCIALVGPYLGGKTTLKTYSLPLNLLRMDIGLEYIAKILPILGRQLWE